MEATSKPVGRPSKTAAFQPMVLGLLRDDPTLSTSAIHDQLRGMGYDGRKSALFEMVATMRRQHGFPSATEQQAAEAERRVAEAERRRAERDQKRAERAERLARWAAETEQKRVDQKRKRAEMFARWDAESAEREARKAREREEFWLAPATRTAQEQRPSDTTVAAPSLAVPEPPMPPPAVTVDPGLLAAVQQLGAGTDNSGALHALMSVIASQAATIAQLTAAQAAPAKKQTTIAELCAAYAKVRQGETSWNEVRQRLAPLARRLGRMRVCDLTPTAWAEHVAVRKTQHTHRDRPPADHTLNVELGRAKEMIDWGVTAGLVATNVLKPAKKIKTISARETFLTELQIQQLLGGISAIPTPHARVITRAFVLCAFDGLMRFNEIRHLRRDRISKDGVIELQAKQTKSRKRRTIALTPRTMAALADISPVDGSQYIFANPETGRPYGRAIFAWFRVACIASKIDAYAAEGEKVVIHSLRHSGASAADARGASPSAIKEALGHSSLATTERYLHRHREAGALELARLMAKGAEAEQKAEVA